MYLHGLSQYLELWNNWVILPILTLAALNLHVRKQKISTRLIFVGLCFCLVGQLTTFTYKEPLNTMHILGMAISLSGLLFFILGSIQYFRKDHNT